MLQKLYGTNLPKRIRNAQVLPWQELQNAKTIAQSKKSPLPFMENEALKNEIFDIAENNQINNVGMDVALFAAVFDKTDEEIFVNKAQCAYKGGNPHPTYKDVWTYFKEKMISERRQQRWEIYLQQSSVLPQVFEHRQQLQDIVLGN